MPRRARACERRPVGVRKHPCVRPHAPSHCRARALVARGREYAGSSPRSGAAPWGTRYRSQYPIACSCSVSPRCGRAAAQEVPLELAGRHDPRRAVGAQAAECPVRLPRARCRAVRLPSMTNHASRRYFDRNELDGTIPDSLSALNLLTGLCDRPARNPAPCPCVHFRL